MLFLMPENGRGFLTSRSEAVKTIEHGGFAGRTRFEFGNAIEENAPQFCEIFGGEGRTDRLFEVLKGNADRFESMWIHMGPRSFVRCTTYRTGMPEEFVRAITKVYKPGTSQLSNP
jgi:hypothetical protein